MKTLRYSLLLIHLLPGLFTAQPNQAILINYGPGPSILINNAIRAVEGDPYIFVDNRTLFISFDYSEMGVCKYANLWEFLEQSTEKRSTDDAIDVISLWQEGFQNFEAAFRIRFGRALEHQGFVISDSRTDSTLHMVFKVKHLEPHRHKKDMGRNLHYLYGVCTFAIGDGYPAVTYELTAFGSKAKTDIERANECFSNSGAMIAGKIRSYLTKRARDLAEQ